MKQRKPRTEKVRSEKKKRTDWGYKRRQKSTSIYFLLWTAFSGLALIVVLLFGFTQWFVVENTYKSEAAKDVTSKGRRVEYSLKNPPSQFADNPGFYLRVLANDFNLNIVVLNETGEVILPQSPDLPTGEQVDFSQKFARLQQELSDARQAEVTYFGNGECVYGKNISLNGQGNYYLYVSRPLELLETSLSQLSVRMLLISIFVFVLAFALSSAISGWFTRPLIEMTDKARQLAQGDFNVDFHGAEYGAEMVELADAFNYARDEISKTDSMQKELIANVSHDFKTPLTMIKAYASMIIEISGGNKEKREKHAQVIIDEADRLASLVGDVLDLSKIRSGINALQMRTFNMSIYLREILERFSYLTTTGGYTFVADIQPNLFTGADDLKIGQALYNLIGNAVNYTGDDKTVYISLQKTSDEIFRFSVRDTGDGIAPNEIATIWDRYYRSDKAHKRPVQGTGLGLSIVKTILEKHKFAFGVESEVGKGSTFFVDFPLVEKEEP